MFRRPLALLVEDSEDDAFFFRWALRKCGLECELIHVADGGSAIRYLESIAQGQARRPDVVFLDLKLPTYSGFEILSWLQRNALHPALRVVILSGSEHTGDIGRATELGAAGYFVKPISAEQLRGELERIQQEIGAAVARA